MTVRKFRSVEDMPPSPRARTPLDGLAAACALSELGAILGVRRAPQRGVSRYRSIQDAAAAREAWERERP